MTRSARVHTIFGHDILIRPQRVLVEAPRWMLLLTLAFAPWAYGSTRPWAIQILSGLAGAICLLWLVECLLRRRTPELPLIPVIATGLLLLHGWWMALNAHFSFDANVELLLPRKPWVPGAPGAADGPVSTSAMLLDTGLLGVLLFVCDLSQRAVWRKRIWATIVLIGSSIAIFGIFQKIGGQAALALIWEPEKRDLANNFATFRYRANAGAYLNLILPLAAGLTFVNLQKPDRHWLKCFWLTALFVVVAGIQLNPSRASWCIALLLGIVLAARIVWQFWRGVAGESQKRLVLGYATVVTVILIALAGITALGNWETSWRRIGAMGLSPAGRSPMEIYLKMVPDAGLMGFGPGSFGIVFPTYQRNHDFGDREFPVEWVTGFWQQAHQDYLQTLIEWGYLGTGFWALLVVGGILRAVRRLRQRTDPSLRWLLFCGLLAIGGTLIHCLVDFPLQIASIQFHVAVLLGMCWGAKTLGESAPARPGN